MKLYVEPFMIAAPFYGLLVIAEVLLAKYKLIDASYEPVDTGVSLGMGAINILASFLFSGISYIAIFEASRYSLFKFSGDHPLTWFALFFADDFVYYWSHRVSHHVRLWWAVHVNHHSSRHFNLATAMRQPFTVELLGTTWLGWLSLAFIGFSPACIFFQKSLNLVYQIWIHTEAVKKLPRPLEAIFNTPSHHRVHHARNFIYLDKNFGGILIIWDRLFGTYQSELDETPCRYGLTQDLGDYNFFRAIFHEWISIYHDLRAERSLWRKLRLLFARPGGKSLNDGWLQPDAPAQRVVNDSEGVVSQNIER